MTTPTEPAPLSDTADPTDPSERAARRGAQVALAGFVLLSSAFVIASTWQLAQGLLLGPPPSMPAAAGAPRAGYHAPCANEGPPPGPPMPSPARAR